MEKPELSLVFKKNPNKQALRLSCDLKSIFLWMETFRFMPMRTSKNEIRGTVNEVSSIEKVYPKAGKEG